MKRYNLPKRPRQPYGLKRYAELIGNYKKYRIKSLYGNKVTWANQIRILRQNFEQLGAIIGGTFINMLKPLVKALNNVMSHIIAFAETVSNALGKIFGWKYEVGGGGVTSDLEDGAGYSDDIASGLDDAQKNAKKMRDYVLGIDELNIISPDTDTSTSGGGTGGAGGATGGQWVEQDSLFKEFESEIDTLYELGETIRDALIGAMESIDWESVYEKARGFGKGLAEFLNGLLAYDGEGRTLFGEIGKTFANTLNTIVYSAQSFAKEFDFHQFGVNLADGINNFFRNFDFEALADTLNTWVDGLKDAIRGFLETLTWKDIISGITDFLGTLELDTVEFIIGAMILKTKGAELRKMVTSAILTKLSLDKITLPSLALVFPKIASVNFSSASFQVIGESIVKELENILDSILPEWLKKWIGEFVAGFSLGGVASGGNPFVAILSGLISAIPYKDILFDMSWAEYWFDEMMKSFESLSSEADWFGIGSRIIEGIAEGFLGALAFIIQPIHNLFTMIWNAICEVFGIHSPAEEMKPLGEYIFLGIVEGFSSMFEEFATTMTEFWDNYIAPWFTFEKWYELLNGIYEAFLIKWEELTTWWNESAIVTWWEESVAPWFTLEKWSTLYDSIKTSLTTKWTETVTLWKTNIQKWWTEHVQPWFTKERWLTLGENLKNGIYEGFKGLANKVVDVLNNVISSLESLINNAISGINDLLSKVSESGIGQFIEGFTGLELSIGTVSFGRIPHFYTGGFPDSASLFWAGENGVTELLGTVNGRTAVVGGNEITGITDAVYTTGQAEVEAIREQNALLGNILTAILEKELSLGDREVVESYERGRSRMGYAF